MSNDESTQEENEDSGINITLGKVIAYPVGLFFILSGLAGLFTNLIAGVLILLGGIISLPIVRSKLKQSKGISMSRWATLGVVLILVVAGGFAFNPSGGQDTTTNQQSQPSQQTELVSASDDLVPTIDQFGSGWQGGTEGNNTAVYFNVETDTVVRYNVTVYESVSAAKSTLEERRPENRGTDSVSIGDSGYIYAVGDRSYVVQVRVSNAICRTQYSGGLAVATPETNSINFAERCVDSISN